MLIKNNHDLGRLGENIAREYYINLGWTLYAQNYQVKKIELDLVFVKNKTVLIVEVKTRRQNYFGFPEESVDQRKRQHIYQGSQNIMQKFGKKYSYNWEVCSIIITGQKAMISTWPLE